MFQKLVPIAKLLLEKASFIGNVTFELTIAKVILAISAIHPNPIHDLDEFPVVEVKTPHLDFPTLSYQIKS